MELPLCSDDDPMTSVSKDNHPLFCHLHHRDLNGGAGSGHGSSSKIPVQDQQIALCLILELAVQKGALSSVLQAVLLLLNLWNNSHHDYDNRVSSSLVSAPLIPLLKRFEAIQNSKSKAAHSGMKWEEVVFVVVKCYVCFYNVHCLFIF